MKHEGKELGFLYTLTKEGEEVTLLDVIKYDENGKGETSYNEGAINQYLIASGVDPELPYLEYLKEEKKLIEYLSRFAMPEDKYCGCMPSVHFHHK